MSQLNWGILGTGSIATNFSKGVARSKTGRLVAVASRSADKAHKFGDDLSIPNRHDSYEALLADPQVQIVYIATPHPMHVEWVIKAAEAGKHILVEKPIGLNFAEAMTAIEAARQADVFLMEAFMYRCHPQTLKLAELIRSNAIGRISLIHATFSFHWPRTFDPQSRLLANDLGGGGILDVGGYPISMARLIAGAAMGKEFEDPIELKAVGHLESTGVDGYAIASLKFPGEILAQCSAAVQSAQDSFVKVFGSEGSILVGDPWTPVREGGTVKINLSRRDKPPEEIAIDAAPLYAIEADNVAAHIARRQSPAMSWDDTLGNMRTLDQWRSQIGLVYEREKLAHLRPAARRPLSVRTDHPMKYGTIRGVNKPVSRIAVGSDFSSTQWREALAIFDDFFRRGGTLFDTAWLYGGNTPTNGDRVLGNWVNSRGLREKVVVLGKGAHTPLCNPRDMNSQLLETLERSGLGYLDIYMLHRDNPDVPVGEFVDALNQHKKAGRIRCFGGSNWSIPRIEQANDYAAKNGLEGMTVISNNLCLAEMIQAPWAGCIHSSDAQSRAWFTRTKTPLIAWSSQGRGFFLPGRAAPDKTDDRELVRCWYSPDNFKRLERANQMAAKRGVQAINIALAYVLCQPFPTFALIGPRRISETRSSLEALKIDLSPDELKWLNLEEGPKT
jgi:predicted dehydrogenase/aryl-alcohol dehydrogenase-like predicted oxidoreductase